MYFALVLQLLVQAIELEAETFLEAMKDLENAISAHDATKFAAAFNDLTDGCNSCHTALNLGFIVIKTPEASSFPDQEFKRR